MALYLSAGHGHKDPGALAFDNRQEHDLASLVVDSLRVGGNTHVYSTTEYRHHFGDRIKWLNTLQPDDTYVEFHFNANMADATGCESFVHDDTSLENRLFASELTEACAKALGIRNRGVKSETESARKRLGILHTVPRVVLLEVCFLNEHDLRKFDAAMKTRHLNDQLAKVLKTASR